MAVEVGATSKVAEVLDGGEAIGEATGAAIGGAIEAATGAG